MVQGLDYADYPHPSPAAIRAAGYGFVMRYISTSAANDLSGKNLQHAELGSLLAEGIEVGLVFEYGAQQMLGGHAQGVADATFSDAVCKGLGMTGAPVYFAADWDATQAQQVPIDAYLDGAASVIGRGRAGIYGGYYPVKRALDAGKATWAWQTLAWSGGQWDSRAQLRQSGGAVVGGASCDVNEAMAADFGQWPRPGVPVKPPVAPEYPVPASLSVTPRLAVVLAWPPGSPVSPHWRAQVAHDAGGKPGALVPGGTAIDVTLPHATIAVPGPGKYWARVQAAGNSPFTAWHEVTV